MTKKDGIIKEEEVHEKSNDNPDIQPRKDQVVPHESDTIKNAHASGLGSIGRNEEQKRMDEKGEKY